MAFVQKIPQAQFLHVPAAGSQLWATIDGNRLLCDFRGDVQVLGRLPEDRRYKVYNESLHNGFAWVMAKDIEVAEEDKKAA